MGNLFSTKTISSSPEITHTHQKTRDDLSQGLKLLRERKIIASTETKRLEGFNVNQPSISTSSVENKLEELQNDFDSKLEELGKIEKQYEEEVKNSQGTKDDLAKINETKKKLHKIRDEVNKLSVEINYYIQEVAIPEIDNTKQDLNKNDPLIHNYTNELLNEEKQSEVPPVYYALDENVEILERMRYYWYIIYFVVIIGILVILYMMGFGLGKVVNQVQKVPQTFSKGFEFIF